MPARFEARASTFALLSAFFTPPLALAINPARLAGSPHRSLPTARRAAETLKLLAREVPLIAILQEAQAQAFPPTRALTSA